jgi:hypothetical protein
MAFKANGTLLKIGANAVAEVTTITDIGLTKETTDVSNLASTIVEHISTGMLDPGEIGVEGFMNVSDTNGQTAMYNALVSGTALNFSVLYPSSILEFTFTGIVTKFSTSAELNGVVPFSATIRTSTAFAKNVVASGGLTALSLTGTGGAIAPAFSAVVLKYLFSGVTGTSVTVTATAASHTLVLFVDGVYSQVLTSGSPSAAIPVTIGVVKELTIFANEAGKVTQVTEINVLKTA